MARRRVTSARRRPTGSSFCTHALQGITVLCLLSGSVTIASAQTFGTPVPPPLVHELRATVSALSRATVGRTNQVTARVWMSSIEAVTNVAIDVLLLPPDNTDLSTQDVQVTDVDGVTRRWWDGPVVVARALMPGRHTVSMRWDSASLTPADRLRVAAGMRTVTRRVTAELSVVQPN